MIKKVDSIEFIYKGKAEIDEEKNIKVIDYFNRLQQKTNLMHEGEILIVSDFTKNEDDYIIELKETTFSNYIYSRDKNDGDIRTMFSASYIITKDNYLVCVLNNYYENDLKFETLNLIGGMSDANDIIDGKYSSEKNLKREIKEELGFDIDNDNWNIQLKYLKYPSEKENPVGYPIGTIYEINASYTKEQIEKMFKKELHDNEVKELVFFSKNNYKRIYEFEHKKQYMNELFEMIFN